MRLGSSRNPPQNGGRGTVWPANRSSVARYSSSSCSRLGRTWLCGRGPGAELAAAWARVEVRVGLVLRQAPDSALDANLFVERRPVEAQRGVRIGVELPALAARVIRMKDESALVDASQQDHADRRSAVRVRRAERDRRSVDLMRFRAFERVLKLGDRTRAGHDSGLLRGFFERVEHAGERRHVTGRHAFEHT